MNISKKEDKEK